MRVGFIGLGNIGLPMAKRLVAAGLDTSVYDVVSERAAGLASDEARPWLDLIFAGGEEA